MATFTAFNVEAEESDDEEVDNTKEIQIEDALKLYQQALKYQSLGSQYFPLAFQTYDTLLKSEIFKYPEALSDWQKTSSQVQDYDVDDLIIVEDEEALLPSNGNDTTPSTVPQIIYLIYKNYGELILKDVFGRLQDPSFQTMSQNDQSQTKIAAQKYAKQALQHFANALERDETDLELWRETARLTGESFQSLRLLRFCLESVLDQDSEVSTSLFDRLNLDERIARKDLLQVLGRISDSLSLLQMPESRESKSKLRPDSLGGSLRTLPGLTSQSNSVPSVRPIYPASRTWAGVGWAIMKALQDEELGVGQFAPGTGWTIMLPPEQMVPTHSRLGPTNPVLPSQGFHPAPTGMQQGGQYRGQSEFQTHPRNIPPLQPLQTASTVFVPPIGQPTTDAVSPSATASAAQSALTDTPTMNLPTRKRSSASAGNDDNADGMRGRSKRIRARESNADILGQDGETSIVTQEPIYMKKLKPLLEADRYMINAMRDIYSKLDMDQGAYIESAQNLAELINFRSSIPEHPYTEDDRVLVSDLVATGTSWNAEKAQALLRDTVSAHDASATSLDVFLEHLRNPGQSIMNIPNLSGQDELLEFLTSLQDPSGDSWLGVHQLCFRWLEVLFCPSNKWNRGELKSSMYVRWLWPAELKQVIAQMIVFEDGHIFELIKTRSARIESRVLKAESEGKTYTFSHEDIQLAEMAETLYELHLDIYSLITSPSSAVDTETRIGQRDRLSRWSALAYGLIYDIENRIGQPDRLSRWGTLTYSAVSHHGKTTGPPAKLEHLTIRYLWAATMHVKVAEDASREHVLLCLKDLRRMLHDAHNPLILLPNNAIMPEISTIAIDQELSKVNTMDYFFKIFNADATDSFMVIESLEPILDLAASKPVRSSEDTSEADELEPEEVSPLVHEMVRLLDRGSTSLKLFLWRRLQNAYDSIGYNSKAICCHLRCIDIIIRDMLAPKTDSLTAHERQISILKSLRSLDTLLDQAVDRIMGDPESLQAIDYELEQTSLCSLASLLRVLYCYLLADDFRAFGVALPTTPNEDAIPAALTGIAITIRIRALTLQYVLLKDCMQQTHEPFPRLSEVLAEYLSSIHVVLGFRGQCKDASRLILRFALKEFVRLGVAVQYRFDLAQILFDLYGWKLAPEVQIHDCPPTQLDRETALLHIDFVLNEAKRYNIKDLVKSDLRAMIDKMQQLIGGPESSTAFSINRRLLLSFLKSPINPAKLYRYTRGVGELSMGRVHTESALTAAKGWYFLLGHIALSKFKSQQRFSPSPTDELNIAAAFFKQDLEHGSEKWETWYRLAQTYDAQLYEKLQWGADDINNDREALVIPQRQAIHCYGMAVATAVRDEADSRDANILKAQLFTDFGMRIYSSSREPLSMGVFSVDDFPRHFSNSGNPLYKGQPFRDMKLYSAWKFASVLFKRAIQLKPALWINYYHLGKCLWKMFRNPDSTAKSGKNVEIDEVINALVKAIQNSPQCKDSRQDPTLEPHYKLVSIVHKLVYTGRLGPREGSAYLQATAYARDFPPCDEPDNWEPYILKILERLSKEDKSNWHHRISARAAHVIYDSSKEFHAAMGARHQFSQQIFTKTMVLQVWKPEHEMIGRHFVYTTRYVEFFMSLLIQLNDRTNIDALVRRVRKKPADYFKFPALWDEICAAYLDLLRHQCHVPRGHDVAVFANTAYDEFVACSNRMQVWIQSHRENEEIFALNDLIVAVNELKTRVNGGLLAPILFDDLIADAFALLYERALPALKAQIDGEGNRERMSINHLTTYDGAAEMHVPPSPHPPLLYPPPPSALPFDPSTLARPRPPRGVVKRDLIRKADALLLKPVVVAAPTLMPRPNMEFQSQPPLPIREDLLRENFDSGGASSVPGSVHDSADDESELSEVDESRIAKPLFPGLVGVKDESAVETEEEEAAGDEDGDETGAGEDAGDGAVEQEAEMPPDTQADE